MPFKNKEEAKAYYSKYYKTVRKPKTIEKKLIEPVSESEDEYEEEEPQRSTDTYNEPKHQPYIFHHQQPRQIHNPFSNGFNQSQQVIHSIRFV